MAAQCLVAMASASALLVAATACIVGSEDRPQDGPSDQIETSDQWRVIITRADGSSETVLSTTPPIVCALDEQPRVEYLCGTGYIESQPEPISWDYLPINIGAGDSYSIATPAWLTPEPTPSTPTPTVIGP